MKFTLLSVLALAATSFSLAVPSPPQLEAVGFPAIAAVNTSSTVRIYSQEPSGGILESVFTDSWNNRTLPRHLIKPAPGSPIAAIAKNEYAIRLYYISCDYTVVEAGFDGKSWFVGELSKLKYEVSTSSQVSATYLAGTAAQREIRVYVQAKDNSIQELGYAYTTKWTALRNLGPALPGAGIASTSWVSPTVSIRVYYQDPSNNIVESCLDGTNSYTGQFVQAALPNTPITALSFGNVHIRVYYAANANSMAEGAYDGNWYTGQWTDDYTVGTQLTSFVMNEDEESDVPNGYGTGSVPCAS